MDWNKSLLNCSETQRKELEGERVINAKPDWSLVSLFQSPGSIRFCACCCILGMRGVSATQGLIFIVFTNCFSRNSTQSVLIYSSQMNRQSEMGSVTSCEGTSFSRINICPSRSKFSHSPRPLGDLPHHGSDITGLFSFPPRDTSGAPASAYFPLSDRVSGW